MLKIFCVNKKISRQDVYNTLETKIAFLIKKICCKLVFIFKKRIRLFYVTLAACNKNFKCVRYSFTAQAVCSKGKAHKKKISLEDNED